MRIEQPSLTLDQPLQISQFVVVFVQLTFDHNFY